MIGKIVYLNYGDVDIDSAIVGVRGKDHWCIIGEEWWMLSEYSFSDLQEVNCRIIDLPEVNLLDLVQSGKNTAESLLAAIKCAITASHIPSSTRIKEMKPSRMNS